MTRRELAKKLGVSEPTITRADASKLAGWGYVRVGKGQGTSYAVIVEKKRVEQCADDKDQRKAKYEEARIRKLEIDTQLGTERLAEIKRAAKVEGAELVYEALRVGFGGYAALLEQLENESKRKLKEAYEKCWDETKNALSKLLGN